MHVMSYTQAIDIHDIVINNITVVYVSVETGLRQSIYTDQTGASSIGHHQNHYFKDNHRAT